MGDLRDLQLWLIPQYIIQIAVEQLMEGLSMSDVDFSDMLSLGNAVYDTDFYAAAIQFSDNGDFTNHITFPSGKPFSLGDSSSIPMNWGSAGGVLNPNGGLYMLHIAKPELLSGIIELFFPQYSASKATLYYTRNQTTTTLRNSTPLNIIESDLPLAQFADSLVYLSDRIGNNFAIQNHYSIPIQFIIKVRMAYVDPSYNNAVTFQGET